MAAHPEVHYRKFRDPRHRVIWRAMEHIAMAETYTIMEDDIFITREQRFIEDLERIGVLRTVGGKAYIQDLYYAYPSSANLEYFTRRLGIQ
jgi:replicative DNA helicase